MPVNSSLRLCVLAVALSFTANGYAASDWIQRSNEAAQPTLKVLGDFAPEFAGRLGLSGYDDKVQQLPHDSSERVIKAVGAAQEKLKGQFATEHDPQMRQDLQIMIAANDLQIEGRRINDKYLVPYTDVAQVIFKGESALLDDQVAASRRHSALTRLNRYTGLEQGYSPSTEQAKAQVEAAIADKSLIWPFKQEVEQDLDNTQHYVDGIHQLYKKYDIKDSDKALAALDAQLKSYADWVRTSVLPHARTDFKQPRALYAYNLKSVGLDIAPEELENQAELAYAEIRNELNALAPIVAKAHNIHATDYRDVLRELKKDQIPKGQVENAYHDVIGKIEDIIRSERIVTLPQRPMLMRLATDAETAAIPAPHMQPPPLIGNKGERGTFVLTEGNTGPKGDVSQAYDDFSHRYVVWTLTAHEGRPGHELQFSAMIERGVSVARSLFAFNSVNVEGWALYAEAETKPHEPLEAQLFALQARLQRAARAFLDPQLNLGQITPERALEILTQEVMLSSGMAHQEVERYTFRSPGQATSYFYGYMKLMELRAEAEIALGKKFDRLAFNDFILSQGLLPPALMRQAVVDQFVPAQTKK